MTRGGGRLAEHTPAGIVVLCDSGNRVAFLFARDKIASARPCSPLHAIGPALASVSQHGPADEATQHLRRLHRSPRPERLCFNHALHHVPTAQSDGLPAAFPAVTTCLTTVALSAF